MRTSFFITEKKPENTSADWKFDEDSNDFYHVRDVYDSIDLREGDRISIDNNVFIINTRVYSVEENIFTYFLDPLFNIRA